MKRNGTERNITDILQERNGTNSNKMEGNGTEWIAYKTNWNGTERNESDLINSEFYSFRSVPFHSVPFRNRKMLPASVCSFQANQAENVRVLSSYLMGFVLLFYSENTISMTELEVAQSSATLSNYV